MFDQSRERRSAAMKDHVREMSVSRSRSRGSINGSVSKSTSQNSGISRGKKKMNKKTVIKCNYITPLRSNNGMARLS